MNSSTTKSTIVIGLQFGDEGKGKIVQHEIQKPERYQVCARFNGGPNAGHTIYVDGTKVVTHVIPTAVVYRKEVLIGPGCVIDPIKFQAELDTLREFVHDIEKLVKISYNAHLISNQALIDDSQNDQVGTTKCGIGPTYARKAQRINERIDTKDSDQQYKYLDSDRRYRGCEVVDPSEFLSGKDVLFEGAQGFSLDIDWGAYYPYVTSSSCLASQAMTCGVPPQSIQDIVGVAKIYETYVGKMDFTPEQDRAELTKLQELGHEFGATTSRPRQCNWLNLDRLIKALRINGITHLIINKCDIIQELEVYKLYHHQKLHQFATFPEMQQYIDHTLEALPYLNNITYSSSPNHL